MIEIPRNLLEIRDAFFVCSRAALKAQVGAAMKLGAEISYAVKTNPDLGLLRELHNMGVNFSVSSPRDFLTVMAAGAKPNEVIYYERGLSEERVRWLVRNGCRNFVVESMPAFRNVIAEAGKGFTVIPRIKADSVGNKYSGEYSPGLGVPQIKEILTKCKSLKIKAGVLHHSSSQVEDNIAWANKFKELAEFGPIELIDLGGGIPISYSGGKHDQIFEEIKKGIKKLRASRIIIEPGRFIAGPSCSLVTKVQLIDGENAVLNASVYTSHIDTIIADLILPCRALKTGKQRKYRLLGSTLCNLDVFNPGVELPELAVGDAVVFDNAGAYNFVSEFGSDIKTYMID